MTNIEHRTFNIERRTREKEQMRGISQDDYDRTIGRRCMAERKYDLEDRLLEFAARIIRLV